jgi:hypothetical protein
MRLAEKATEQGEEGVEDNWEVHFLHNVCRKYRVFISIAFGVLCVII